MFPSYLEKPHNLSFKGQDSNETILLVLRAHPITNIPWILRALVVFLLPVFVPRFIEWTQITIPSLPEDLTLSFLIVNYLVVLVIVFEGFLHWYFNVDIITTKRIVDLEFESILSHNVDGAPLQSVEEANGRVAGIFGMLFHFGNVSVQTAGAKLSIQFINVPNPVRVADIVLDQADHVKKGLGE